MTDLREQFDISYYEEELGISRYVVGWLEAIFESLPRTSQKEFLDAFFNAHPNTKDLSNLQHRMLEWQWNNASYGFSHRPLVRNDEVLVSFASELLGLSAFSEELQGKIASSWDVIGEKKRVETMAFARKWAWAGARKWAWVRGRAWRGAWGWLLVASRKQTVSQPTSLISAWNNALKWHKVWESKGKRIHALKDEFLSVVSSSSTKTV